MRCFRVVSLIGLIFLPVTGQSADSFENGVPQALIEAFTDGRLSTGFPEEFPQVSIPDSLSVMGSLDNDYFQSIVFSVAGSLAAGEQELGESLQASGWVLLPAFDFQPQQRGFISPETQELPAEMTADNFCHDNYGLLTVIPNDSGPGSTIMIRLNQSMMMQPGFSCQQQIAQRQMSASRRGGPMGGQSSEIMPRLVLPESSGQGRMPPFAAIGGFSSSGAESEARGNVRGDFDLEELYEHFAGQLREQEWELDSDWNGEYFSGGNWTLDSASGTGFLGVLSILKTADEVFSLKFTLVPRGGRAGDRVQRGFFVQ